MWGETSAHTPLAPTTTTSTAATAITASSTAQWRRRLFGAWELGRGLLDSMVLNTSTSTRHTARRRRSPSTRRDRSRGRRRRRSHSQEDGLLEGPSQDEELYRQSPDWLELRPTPHSDDPPASSSAMPYRALASDDPEDTKRYGSIDSTDSTDAGDSTELGVAIEKSGSNPFADEATAAHWRHVYERCQYECRGAFDPKLTWSAAEERRLVRKLDGRVCLWACIMFFGLQVDRGNLSQAVSDNMLDDLGLNTNDYNYGHAIFLLSFLLAELPSQLVSKAVGPDRWIPVQMVLWSLVAISQCALTGRATFFLTRSLLGLLEGGFIPDLVLWLSYFYTSRELPIRLSYFWTTLSVTGILTSLAAFVLLHMRGVGGWEGSITLLVGVASFFMMPASAVETKTWFRPQGWFSDREVAIVVNRVLRDDPSKGDMHNREALTLARLWEALKDYDLWPLYAMGLIVHVPQSPVKTYLTLTLRAMGFGTFATNLMTIPADIVHICNLLLVTRLSERWNERSFVAILQPLWTLPCLVALRYWPGVFEDRWGTYALVIVLLSYPYCHAILVGWCSKNSNNVGTRTVSAALYNMACQTGGIFASTVYREDDKPLYHRGNSTLLVINLLSIGLFIFAKVYYLYRNNERERRWSALTPEQQIHYRKTTRLEGSRRLDFRFAH